MSILMEKGVPERNSRVAGRGWDRLNREDRGGRKSPKQELMSIIALGKNKPHLKSNGISKQPVTPVTYDGSGRGFHNEAVEGDCYAVVRSHLEGGFGKTLKRSTP